MSFFFQNSRMAILAAAILIPGIAIAQTPQPPIAAPADQLIAQLAQPPVLRPGTGTQPVAGGADDYANRLNGNTVTLRLG